MQRIRFCKVNKRDSHRVRQCRPEQGGGGSVRQEEAEDSRREHRGEAKGGGVTAGSARGRNQRGGVDHRERCITGDAVSVQGGTVAGCDADAPGPPARDNDGSVLVDQRGVRSRLKGKGKNLISAVGLALPF